MYCKKCGSEIRDDAVICPHCGCETGVKSAVTEGVPSAGWGVLGFFFPIVGLILYLVWKNESPKKALMAGKGALIGVIVVVAIWVLVICFSVCTVATFAETMSL